MKTIPPIPANLMPSWFPLFCLLLGAMVSGAQEPPDLLATENLGGIKVGLPEKKLTALIGQPASKGAPVMEEAIGEYIHLWKFPKQCLEIRMTSGEKKNGAKEVSAFTATAGCKLATAKGIKIGSAEAEVRKAYGAVEDKEFREAGSFVAGSIYGGIIFNFAKGKVSRIFFGAAAE